MTRSLLLAAVLLSGMPGLAGLHLTHTVATASADTLLLLDAPRAVGSVQGTLRVLAAPASAPPMLSPYARRRYEPPVRPNGSGRAPESDAVIYILVADAATPAAPAPTRIVQRDRAIRPRVTVVSTGSKIEFPNEDEVFHNIFSLSDAKPFNLGRYAPGDSRAVVFEEPGLVRLFCDIHSDMEASVLVLSTPFFARPDSEGRFQISDVPAGRHILVAWHASAGSDSRDIVVTAGSATLADFNLGR